MLNQDACFSALYRHYHRARMKVNASSYGGSSFLSRLCNILMHFEPQLISTLTYCMFCVHFIQGLHGWYAPNQVSVSHIDIGFKSVHHLAEGLLIVRQFSAIVPHPRLQMQYSSFHRHSEWIASVPFSFRRLSLKAIVVCIASKSSSPRHFALDQFWITRAGMIWISGNVFRRFGDRWSKIMFLIASFLKLPCLPFLILSPRHFVIWFELRGSRTVQELVNFFRLVIASGDPRCDDHLKCMPQACQCQVI